MATKKTHPSGPSLDYEDDKTLANIVSRAHYLAVQMIFQANHRSDKEKGDPKVGGHVSASASSIHILGALHLLVKSGFDLIANKPHASPADHAYNYLLKLFYKANGQALTDEEAYTAMMGLRKFSQAGEPVFQSYHSALDPDGYQFLPSGTVGIPPVNAGYLALAYRYAKKQSFIVPEGAHFWAILGDSEFREGSVFEAIPDFAEREIGNLTWILDYNRQSLDGHRITNNQIMPGNDCVRIEKTMIANGWQVIQLRHGKLRKKLFLREGGQIYQKFLEEVFDYDFQALLLIQDAKLLREKILSHDNQLKKFLGNLSDTELMQSLRDLGGHDLTELKEAMFASRAEKRRPSIIIAHTLKGWGLKMAAAPGNHSALLDQSEMDELREKQGLTKDTLFAGFDANTKEGKFLQQRGDKLRAELQELAKIRSENQRLFQDKLGAFETFPDSLEINTKLVQYPHTQWMLGQLTAKLTRLANIDRSSLQAPNDLRWKDAAELFVSMAPDVGTSTNMNPAMDGKIFAPAVTKDFESEYGVKDTKTPDLIPGQEISDRFIRFEIAEGNVVSCVGSFGKIKELLGIPLLPLMTVYDFFIKRAHDQYFYNLYWKSNFFLCGTPSGVTLSPEGAQHGWKSDFQIPNQITWEPFFIQELDWIFCDAVKRHLYGQNIGRQGVLIRGVTRGVDQKLFLENLRKQKRFKTNPGATLVPEGMSLAGALEESKIAAISDAEILKLIREEVLSGAYYLVDYRGYAGYQPGDNVVHLFAMGSPTTEALAASALLLQKGIYANVIVVTSPDLLCGIQAYENKYQWLKNGLGISGDLYLKGRAEDLSLEWSSLSGKRVPIVSVHDGEAGLLDNLGAIVGVKQIALGVRKHSKCGRPKDIYAYHGIDANAIVAAAEEVMSETAFERVELRSY